MSTAVAPLNLNLCYEGRSVRTAGTQERPEWIAADVGEVLGVQNIRQVLAKFDADEAGVCTTYTSGQAREMATVTEPGLYKLISKSRKPEAKAFQRWIYHEVLPCIRKYGTYPAPACAPPAAPPVPAELLERIMGRMEHMQQQLDRMQALPAAVHIPTHATPRATVRTRLEYKGWREPLANGKRFKKIRADIRRTANMMLRLEYDETPDVSGGPGSECTYYGHQVNVLDEAIDKVRDMVLKGEDRRDQQSKQLIIPFNRRRKVS